MCLIIASPEGDAPEEKVLAHAYAENPHGWGIMYWDGHSIKVEKGFNNYAMIKAVRRVIGNPYVLHFRFATHGKVDRNNTHPFKIRNGLWMAHNGILAIETPNKDYSDTWHFAKELTGLLEESPTYYESVDFTPDISDLIGWGNKLTFLEQGGGIKIVNADQGEWIDGMWFSNEYSLPLWYGYNRYVAPKAHKQTDILTMAEREAMEYATRQDALDEEYTDLYRGAEYWKQRAWGTDKVMTACGS